MWQLPDGIGELVGQQATRLERYRRLLLDCYEQNKYELVIPPIAEYVDSLLLNTSQTLDVKTFKTLDPLSGKMLGIHADITPQIARIDAQYSQEDEVRRFCYINAIMQTKSDDFYSGRSPIQAGAEMYGDASLSADKEIISLMLQSMDILGCQKTNDKMVLSLGDVRIVNALLADDALSVDERDRLFAILNRKSKRGLNEFIEQTPLKNADLLIKLMDFNGDLSVLNEAAECLAGDEQMREIIDSLSNIARSFSSEVTIHIDLAEVKGYEYHSGLLFSLYHPVYKKALAQGGRYDNLSGYFGRSRFATGFSFDLKYLVQHLH